MSPAAKPPRRPAAAPAPSAARRCRAEEVVPRTPRRRQMTVLFCGLVGSYRLWRSASTPTTCSSALQASYHDAVRLRRRALRRLRRTHRRRRCRRVLRLPGGRRGRRRARTCTRHWRWPAEVPRIEAAPGRPAGLAHRCWPPAWSRSASARASPWPAPRPTWPPAFEAAVPARRHRRGAEPRAASPERTVRASTTWENTRSRASKAPVAISMLRRALSRSTAVPLGAVPDTQLAHGWSRRRTCHTLLESLATRRRRPHLWRAGGWRTWTRQVAPDDCA